MAMEMSWTERRMQELEAEWKDATTEDMQKRLDKLEGRTFLGTLKRFYDVILGQIVNWIKITLLSITIGREATKERLNTADKRQREENRNNEIERKFLREKLGLDKPVPNVNKEETKDELDADKTKPAPAADKNGPEPEVAPEEKKEPEMKWISVMKDRLTQEDAKIYDKKNLLNVVFRSGKLPHDFECALESYLYEKSGRFDIGDMKIHIMPEEVAIKDEKGNVQKETHMMLYFPFGEAGKTDHVDMTAFINGSGDQHLIPEQEQYAREAVQFAALYAVQLKKEYGITVNDGIERSNYKSKDKNGNVAPGKVDQRVQSAKIKAEAKEKYDAVKTLEEAIKKFDDIKAGKDIPISSAAKEMIEKAESKEKMQEENKVEVSGEARKLIMKAKSKEEIAVLPMKFCDYLAVFTYIGQNKDGHDTYEVSFLDAGSPEKTAIQTQKFVDEPGQTKTVKGKEIPVTIGDKIAEQMRVFYRSQITHPERSAERCQYLYNRNKEQRPKDIEYLIGIVSDKGYSPSNDDFKTVKEALDQFKDDPSLQDKLTELKEKVPDEWKEELGIKEHETVATVGDASTIINAEVKNAERIDPDVAEAAFLEATKGETPEKPKTTDAPDAADTSEAPNITDDADAPEI